MADLKHTPGPWQAQYSKTNGLNPAVWGKDELLIASCGFALSRPNDENEANARLIAESPRMLDVLYFALRQLEYLDEKYPTGTTPAVLARINEVIAKAEGQQ